MVNIPILEFPWWHIFISPLSDIQHYFLSFFSVKNQLISWILWLTAANIVIYRKRFFKPAAITLTVFFVFIISILFFPVVFFNKIFVSNPEDTILADFHSHTVYSTDGAVTLQDNIRWHKKHGFNAVFITDHNFNTSAETRNKQDFIFSGEEIQDKNGNHLLVLGLNETISKQFYKQETAKIVRYAHKNNGAVIVAHWWQEKGSSLPELKNSGIDGFEVYGHEKKPLSIQDRLLLLSFCKKNKLIAVTGTNWHGLGGANIDSWTVIRIPGWKTKPAVQIKDIIIDSIRKRNTGMFTAVTAFNYSSNYYIYTNLTVFLFEPVLGIFRLAASLTLLKMSVLAIWILILVFLVRKYRLIPFQARYKIKLIVLTGICVLFYFYFCKYFGIWIKYRLHNNMALSIAEAFFVIGLMFSSVLFVSFKRK